MLIIGIQIFRQNTCVFQPAVGVQNRQPSQLRYSETDNGGLNSLGKALFTQVKLMQNCRQLSIQVIESFELPLVVWSHVQSMSAAETTHDSYLNEWIKLRRLKCVQKPTESRLSLTHHANNVIYAMWSSTSMLLWQCQLQKVHVIYVQSMPKWRQEGSL